MYTTLLKTIDRARTLSIPVERKQVLQPLIDYVQDKLNQGLVANLNFICTHNSRRSQFSQIWAQTAAAYYNIPIHSYSGGVEVTAFNERAVSSLQRSGFKITKSGSGNPKYIVNHSEDGESIIAFSKLFDDPANDGKPFAAVMTCSDADENCPFIPGTEQRLPVRYEDPKAFDDTPKETDMYDMRSLQIASELLYVFSQIKSK